VEERYARRDEYLLRITEAAKSLAKQRYVLERDVSGIVEKAAAQWDHTMKEPVQ
jgi:hypothetical protein